MGRADGGVVKDNVDSAGTKQVLECPTPDSRQCDSSVRLFAVDGFFGEKQDFWRK